MVDESAHVESNGLTNTSPETLASSPLPSDETELIPTVPEAHITTRSDSDDDLKTEPRATRSVDLLEPTGDLQTLPTPERKSEADQHEEDEARRAAARAEIIGTNIAGYEIIDHLGSGSHGEVYKASHPAIDHPVVLKVLRTEHQEDAEVIQRFEAEAEVIARLGSHPNIIPLYDFWKGQSGAYIVFRWLDGGSLRDRLDEEGALSLEAASTIVDKLADALHVAHKAGIVHRDIKPENILFDHNGEVYLADFGVAKRQDMNITAPGTVLGTPAYLAPEQILSEQVTCCTDIYSLGLMVYEMLVGERPFTGKLAGQVMMQQLSQPVPLFLHPDAQIQDSVNKVIQKATAKSAAERYDDALELAGAFRTAISA